MAATGNGGARCKRKQSDSGELVGMDNLESIDEESELDDALVEETGMSFFETEPSMIWRTIDSLPDEILRLILSHLSTAQDLAEAQLTCKRWRNILIDPSNDFLWQRAMYDIWQTPIELGCLTWRVKSNPVNTILTIFFFFKTRELVLIYHGRK